MKIVIDDKIPYIRDAVAAITDDAVYMDGSAIKADDVRDADAMIVRTRTRCDERLLGGSRVRFVGTATIGYDHLDTAWLDRAGICWTNCPGCNASSVAQYLRSVLILLARFHGVNLVGTTIGIVGCGHVGTLVCDVALSFGMRVLVCDPPVGASGYVSLETIEREADIITFHVPLTRDGAYPTYHLADEAFFSRLVRRPFIINTSRGAVVDMVLCCVPSTMALCVRPLLTHGSVNLTSTCDCLIGFISVHLTSQDIRQTARPMPTIWSWMPCAVFSVWRLLLSYCLLHCLRVLYIPEIRCNFTIRLTTAGA